MASQTTSTDTVAVIGAGSFGTVMANLLSANQKVLLYDHNPDWLAHLKKEGHYKNRPLNPEIEFVSDLAEICQRCELIFPVIPSAHFRSMMQKLSAHLKPYHRLIHGTKGLDVELEEGVQLSKLSSLSKDKVKTMSALIKAETVVRRIGCVAGPNLAVEIADGQPAATVVASHFDEVLQQGKAALRSGNFRVHGTHDLMGVELAGVLKNIMAIASGIINGLGFGDNTRALLITRGLAEMIYIGKALGADPRAFLGLAGIGDLIATCHSPQSRNFTVGYRMAKGESLDEILESMDEVAEGLKTVCIVKALASHHKIPAPITLTLFKTLFEGMDISRGMRLLMEFPFTEDVEFI